MEKKIVIVHNLENIRHFIKSKHNSENVTFFSTHPCVSTYIRRYLGKDSKCLSSLMGSNKVLEFMEIADKRVGEILHLLDSNISPELNQRFGLRINYFTPLYSYIGKYQLCSYLSLIESLEKLKQIFDSYQVILYDYTFDYFLDSHTSISDLISSEFKDNKFLLISQESNRFISYFQRIRNISQIAKRNIQRFISTLTSSFPLTSNFSVANFSKSLKTILLYENLHDLQFLRTNLANYNLVYYQNHDSRLPHGYECIYKEQGNIDVKISNGSNLIETLSETPTERLFIKDCLNDFSRNIKYYIPTILTLKKIHEEHSLRLGIYGVSPTARSKALVFEYLKSLDIPIVGAQHGATLADSYYPWHLCSDFDRCDYLLSYGFSQDDLKRVYPDRPITTKIVPVGRSKCSGVLSNRRDIDIFFPLANCYSMLNEGMSINVLPHELEKRQNFILNFLDNLKDFTVGVKPVANASSHDCIAMLLRNSFKHIRMFSNMTVEEFLSYYNPRLIIIEFPSTSLYEVLDTDSEVILMRGDAVNYEPLCLSELTKRIHYCENIDDCIKAISLFTEGKLSKKRDTTFQDHYIYQENRELKILNLINSLCS